MNNPVIVDAVRTPFGKRDGALADMHPQDLAAEPLVALRERNGFAPETIEDVIYGCVTPIDEQGLNIARLAPMVAGWGDGVPGVQLNRMCGSGQQAVNFAAGQVASGAHDVLIAGGVEHMTRVPMGSDGQSVTDTYFEHFDELTTQGEGAERIAETYDFSRRTLDELAADSQSRCGDAWEAGHYDEQVVSVDTEVGDERVELTRDEHMRPDTDAETLSSLPLSFRDPGEGVHHAGNASGIVDGASALLVTSEAAAEEHGWEPMARIVDSHVVGVDPVTMLTGPIPATEELLAQHDLTVDDIDRFEVNEAFAAVVEAWLDETGADWDRTNVWGGAIAHGHPLGATGAALLGKLPYQLAACDGQYGLCTMCIGFGQGIATIIERY
ncbi:acetyl-CoA C-acyltransferase [Natronomonas pharaonis DSM 2160]|uniref:Acetyl-CoA C-acyltransferase n=1 Tax=Natronomonas pharaonis (strain ATCC 35678 / DSM 2160 / CIP 103997 / JCM 8858 / NBRC 14720 / NCIMB 2260 / Gabara) TaxID=348780 RepID=A0A1U7EYR1_NATPD|nr:thiolase family protein [Natronomonas pharaonis]CAI50381.1 acetyl-CoA C-acyltransferase [Natronomonas pharaonis DSM 2160]